MRGNTRQLPTDTRTLTKSFILRFWNQILTCLSVRLTPLLISRRRSRVRYILKRNSFSNSKLRAGHRAFHIALFLPGAGLEIRAFYRDRRRRGLRFRGDPAELRQCLVGTRRLVAEAFLMFPIRISLAQSEIARNRDLGTVDRRRFGNNIFTCRSDKFNILDS
ncbi:hypothetical protein EYF80_029434 [Liparis tanakae]|uniref:Uncharacterized protein n=1 Tax=Liparis tanakae TaxID=230148 RepID=A0A4Z2H5P1_9TELE|nr:hypothetical protein EYF80_029434 [Liparis tanakae]